MTLARFVTDFADQAVLLPAAAAVLLLFLLARWWRGALCWAVAVGATLAATLGAKLVALACGSCLPSAGFHSPSGHTAAGAMIYGGLLALLLRRARPARRRAPGAWAGGGGLALPLACTAAVAVLIGLSRLALGVHSPAETLAGGLVGVAGGTCFVQAAGPAGPRLRAWHLAAVVGLAAVALHGIHMPAEASIRHAAAGVFPACRTCR